MKKNLKSEKSKVFCPVTNDFCRDMMHADAHSHFFLVLFAARQFALLVQEVDEAHQQQEQQNTHHHSYHHSAGASLLLVGCSAANQGRHGRRDG